MIHLYRFYPAFGLADPSPFCVKVETFLRMVEAEYRNHHLTDPRKGPKGKLPYIEDGDKTIADSTFILKYLIETYRYPIDAHLGPAQHATGIAVNRMLEEHLYWAIVYERWVDDSVWPEIRAYLFGRMPPVIRSLVPWIARKRVKGALYAQGTSRHSPEQIKTLAEDDIGAVSHLLADKNFLLGDSISSYDASVYAFLSSILYFTLGSRYRQHLLGFENLVRYCDRIREAYYPETR